MIWPRNNFIFIFLFLFLFYFYFIRTLFFPAILSEKLTTSLECIYLFNRLLALYPEFERELIYFN